MVFEYASGLEKVAHEPKAGGDPNRSMSMGDTVIGQPRKKRFSAGETSPIIRLDRLRDRLLNGTLLALAVIGLPGYVTGLLEALQLDQWPMALIYSVMYGTILGTALLAKRLPYSLRAAVLLALSYLFGLTILAEFGLSGTGPVILLTLCVYATALFGLRAGLWATGLSVATLAAVGSLMCMGLLDFRQELALNSVTPISWLVTGALFLMLVLTLVISAGMMLGHMEDSLRLVHDRTNEMQESNIRLEQEAASRKKTETENEELSKQLLHAQKMEAIGRLAGGVAHDFNNLLTVINSNAEIALRRNPNSAEMRDIYQAAKRATALTRQLLAFSRKQIIRVQPLDLNSLLRELSKMLGRMIGEDIEVDLSGCEAQGGIKADPGQIEQVVINLAVNARDAMPKGGRLILATQDLHFTPDDAKLPPGLAPGAHVRLTVSDTGAGMDAATRERVFEPFFTTKPPDRGTGLGLSTVFGIIKQHRGEIRVESEPGAGTTFELFFPRVLPEQLRKDTPPSFKLPPRGTETILLVEDDPQVLRSSQRILEGLGYTLLTAASGGQALELAKGVSQAPDLLMTDVVMPGMNGRELAESLLPDFPSIKVIYISGHTGDTVLKAGIRQGQAEFLAKPFSPSELANKIRSVLDCPLATG